MCQYLEDSTVPLKSWKVTFVGITVAEQQISLSNFSEELYHQIFAIEMLITYSIFISCTNRVRTQRSVYKITFLY